MARQLPAEVDMDLFDEAPAPAGRRQTGSHKARVERSKELSGLPPDYIQKSIFWVRDEQTNLWVKQGLTCLLRMRK